MFLDNFLRKSVASSNCRALTDAGEWSKMWLLAALPDFLSRMHWIGWDVQEQRFLWQSGCEWCSLSGRGIGHCWVWFGKVFFFKLETDHTEGGSNYAVCLYVSIKMDVCCVFAFIHVNVNCNCTVNHRNALLSFYEWYVHVFGKHARIHCHNDWTVALEWDWAHGEVDGIWMQFFWIRRIQMLREASARFRLAVTLARTTRADAFRVVMYIIYPFWFWFHLRIFEVFFTHESISFGIIGGSSCRRNSDWAVSSQGYREDHGSADPGDDLQRDGRAWQ